MVLLAQKKGLGYAAVQKISNMVGIPFAALEHISKTGQESDGKVS